MPFLYWDIHLNSTLNVKFQQLCFRLIGNTHESVQNLFVQLMRCILSDVNWGAHWVYTDSFGWKNSQHQFGALPDAPHEIGTAYIHQSTKQHENSVMWSMTGCLGSLRWFKSLVPPKKREWDRVSLICQTVSIWSPLIAQLKRQATKYQCESWIVSNSRQVPNIMSVKHDSLSPSSFSGWNGCPSVRYVVWRLRGM